MARYTKKDADGRYYIESVNGKLESDKFGHTYGESIDRFAELENADVAPRAEVEYLKEHLEMWCNKHKKAREEIERLEAKIAQYQLDLHYSVCREDEAKENVATKIFEELEYLSMDGRIPMNGYYADLKKKYTEEQK